MALPDINWSNSGDILKLNASMWDGLPLDDYQWNNVDPQKYSWLTDYLPSQYQASTLSGNPQAETSLLSNVNPYAVQNYDGYVGEQSNIDLSSQNESRGLQLEALKELGLISSEGMTADERAAVSNIRNAAQAVNAQNQRSILRDMEEKGTLDSGSSLMARLSASQNASNQANMNSTALSQQLLDRQMAGVQAQGGLSTNIRSQDQSIADRQAQMYENFQQRRESIVNNARKYAADQANTSNAWAAATNASNQAQNASEQNNNNRFNSNLQSQRDIWNATSLNEQNKSNNDNANAAQLANLQGRQTIANQNNDLLNQWNLTNQQLNNQTTGMRNQDRITAMTNFSNALNGQAGSVDRWNAAQLQADASKEAGKDSMWGNIIGGGIKVLGSLL